MTGTRAVEYVAVVFGILSVYLNSRQNPWGWGTGLINVGLYTVLFFQGKLYALMGLQVFFAIISIYGWYQWLRGGTQREGVRVTRTPPPLGAVAAGVAVVGSLGLGWYLDTQTQDQQPYVDASVSVISLIGQWLMARKHLEAWHIWIAVNLASVPLFLVRGEYPTAFQYTIFLGLAVSGLRQWHRSLVESS